MRYGVENDLTVWHALCRAIGVEPLPRTCEVGERVTKFGRFILTRIVTDAHILSRRMKLFTPAIVRRQVMNTIVQNAAQLADMSSVVVRLLMLREL
jgi:hypothetical protein